MLDIRYAQPLQNIHLIATGTGQGEEIVLQLFYFTTFKVVPQTETMNTHSFPLEKYCLAMPDIQQSLLEIG